MTFTRYLVLVGALASLSGCCWLHLCKCDPPPPKCWEGPQADEFAWAEPEGITTRMRVRQEKTCAEYRTNIAARKAFDRISWTRDCPTYFNTFVMQERCGPRITEYCQRRCPGMRDSCNSAGRSTLEAACAAASFPMFQQKFGYCAAAKLEGTHIVPLDDGQPKCSIP